MGQDEFEGEQDTDSGCDDSDDAHFRSDAHSQADRGVGDDFDEFEAGAENDDFGDFDDGFQQPAKSDEEREETEPSERPIKSIPPLTSPFVSTLVQ